MIAQEVEAVFPELVTTWGKDGYKAVAYDTLNGNAAYHQRPDEGINAQA